MTKLAKYFKVNLLLVGVMLTFGVPLVVGRCLFIYGLMVKTTFDFHKCRGFCHAPISLNGNSVKSGSEIPTGPMGNKNTYRDEIKFRWIAL